MMVTTLKYIYIYIYIINKKLDVQFCNFLDFKSEKDDMKQCRGQIQTQMSHMSTTALSGAQGRGIDNNFKSLLSLIATQTQKD